VIAARRTAGGIRVTVRDNGIGIAPDDRARVFALFSRLTQTAGHGIGLTTVARVAEAHGGRTGVDDTPTGVGIEIWFEIPD
jgi:signal transduction histidine kinase